MRKQSCSSSRKAGAPRPSPGGSERATRDSIIANQTSSGPTVDGEASAGEQRARRTGRAFVCFFRPDAWLIYTHCLERWNIDEARYHGAGTRSGSAKFPTFVDFALSSTMPATEGSKSTLPEVLFVLLRLVCARRAAVATCVSPLDFAPRVMCQINNTINTVFIYAIYLAIKPFRGALHFA